MEATLPSSQMLLEVDGILVKTGEDRHGFALPLFDRLYGTFDKGHAALRLRPDPRAYFTPNCTMTCSASGFAYAKITALFGLRPIRRFGCDSS
jgi:hypothetical protein